MGQHKCYVIFALGLEEFITFALVPSCLWGGVVSCSTRSKH
jgi:hypothetical protein